MRQTEERLRQYSIENKQSIELNNAKREQEYEKFIKLQKLERQYKSERNRLNAQVMEEEKKLKNLSKVAIIDQLQNATDKDPELILETIRNTTLEKTKKCKDQLLQLEDRYIRQKEAIEKNLTLNDIKNKNKSKIPFSPFNGDMLKEKPFKFNVDIYKDPFLNKMIDENIQYQASGYNINDYYERTLNDAFMGLECFISKEKQTV